jgi:hypothetical protein
MKHDNFSRKGYHSDDYSRFAAPDYLDRISLSHADSGRVLSREAQTHRSDTFIYEEICEALLNDPYVDATNIEVQVEDGIVTLKGHVESREMKKDSELCIEHIHGIVDVFNLLTLYQFKEAGAHGLVKYQARI